MKISITATIVLISMLAMSIGLAVDLKKLNTQEDMGVNNNSQHQSGSNGINNLAIPFGPNCAPGFSFFGKKIVLTSF